VRFCEKVKSKELRETAIGVLEEVYPSDLGEVKEALADANIYTDGRVSEAYDRATAGMRRYVDKALKFLSARAEGSIADTLPKLSEPDRQRANEYLARLIPALRKAQVNEVYRDMVNAIKAEKHHRITGCLIVFVGGGGAAGKSTFSKRLEKLMEHESISCRRIELDRYFQPIESIGGRVSDGKYDNPLNSDMDRARENVRAISEGRWENLTLPVHDKKEHKKERQHSKHAELRGAAVVIVEGLYALGPCFEGVEGIRIFIDASPTDRAKGRIWRDINVRKRSEQHVVEMLLGRETYHQTFVEPTQIVADYIIRRAPTSGALGVIDSAEMRNSLLEACLGSGLTKGQPGKILRRFEELQEKAQTRHAGRTEF
jgi:uridine kinase